MPLIHNSLGNLFGGVSQQPAVDRQPNQVKEMINCVPTVESGLLKRNPMEEIITDTLSFSDGLFSYEYDRGYSSANNDDRFSIQLNGSDHKIINLGSGESQTIKYSDEEQFLNDGVTANPQYISVAADRTDRSYLTSGVRSNFAGVTLKDTTFLTNKTFVPTLYELDSDPVGDIVEARAYVDIEFHEDNSIDLGTAGIITNVEPIEFDPLFFTDLPTTTTLTANNIDIIQRDSSNSPQDYLSMSLFLNKTIQKMYEEFASTFELIKINSNTIRIRALTISQTVTVTFTGEYVDTFDSNTVKPLVMTPFVTLTSGSENVNLVTQDQSYKEQGYIWFQKSEPVSGYSYTARIKVIEVATGTETSLTPTSVTSTTTEGAATAMATALSGLNSILEVGLVAVGSVCRVSCVDGYEILEVNTSDTFGNLASHGWGTTIDQLTNLPRSFPFSAAIVKVTGEDTDERNDYWVKRIGDIWQEWYDPFARRNINSSTMPRIIKDNNDGSFTVSKYTGWESMLVGDETTNGIPSFLSTEDNPTPVIKDMFFHKNRLGLLSDRSITFSEIGRIGNFWKTTVVSALDSDRIDGFVDSKSSVKLEYATNLEDLIVLFSSSEQFVVNSPDILSSKTIQVSKVSAYNINTEIRPIFFNNALFFCAIRGRYTQVMKYKLSELSGKTVIASDTTLVTPRYIPSNINSFTFSSTNDMIFITSLEDRNTVYVLKQTLSDNDVVQSAWFKWRFQADIFKAFAFDDKLYLLTKTYTNPDNDTWILAHAVWDDLGIWYDTDLWRDAASDIASEAKIQSVDIFNDLDDTKVYLDDGLTIYTSSVDIGEWVYTSGGTKEPRGHLHLKTIELDSSDDSSFSLAIFDKKRSSTRFVSSDYTKNRKPMIYGNSENVSLSIINNNAEGIGFKIYDVSLEGNFNIRSRRR